MIVAIMQPTFLPWAGYFGMIMKSDLFIFLDDVQFARRSWQQRNQILINKKKTWITVSIESKGQRDQKLNKTKIDYSNFLVNKFLQTIKFSYKNTKYFNDYYPGMENIFMKKISSISELNINLINYFSSVLDIKKKFINSSDLKSYGKKENYIFNLVKEVSGKVYLSAEGSRKYIENSEELKNQEFEIKFFNFNQIPYKQSSDKFVSNLSIIDMIFNIGKESKNLIDKSTIII